MGKLTVLWLLLAALNVALTDDTVVYFTDGGQLTIEVRPPFPDRITDILWMLNGNLLAEWDKKLTTPFYYPAFEGRSTLSSSTGQLVINNMTKNEQGVYSVTINGKVQSKTYTAELIKTVPKPEVVMRPLTCSVKSESCDASCGEDIVGAGPVTYSWKKGDGKWEESKKVITITKTQDAGVETLTCQIQNPVSKERSDPKKNTLYNPSTTPVSAIVSGVIVAALVIGGLGGLYVAWKKKIGPFKNRSTNSTELQPGNGHPTSHPDDATAEHEEKESLKTNHSDPKSDAQEP